MIAQPGVGLELEGVGRLVQRDEGAELPERDAEGRRAGRDVWLDEVQAATSRRCRGEQADVVLAEHLAGEECHQQPELLVAERPIQDPAPGPVPGYRLRWWHR